MTPSVEVVADPSNGFEGLHWRHAMAVWGKSDLEAGT